MLSFPFVYTFCFPQSALFAFPTVNLVLAKTDRNPCFSSCILCTSSPSTFSTIPLFWEAARIFYFNFRIALSFHWGTQLVLLGFEWFILRSCFKVVGLLPKKVLFLRYFFFGWKLYYSLLCFLYFLVCFLRTLFIVSWSFLTTGRTCTFSAFSDAFWQVQN